MILSDSSLTIDYSNLLGYPCTITVTSWSSGIACFGLSNGETTTFNKFLDDPGLPFEDILNNPEAKLWLDTFPENILEEVRKYHTTDGASIYPLLWLLSRYQCAVDLFISSPLLMMIIMHCAKLYHWNELGVINLLLQKRNHILERCYLGGGKPLLKLFNKLPLEAFSHKKYLLIKKFLALPKWQTINHLKYVDDGLILLITQHPELLSSRLVKSYDKSWSIGKFRRFYSDTLRMATLQNQERVLSCRTPDDLERLHDQYTAEIVTTPSLDSFSRQSHLNGNQRIIPFVSHCL